MTVQQTAEYLIVDDETVRRMIRAGELKAHRVARDYRIYKSDVEKYIQDNKVSVEGK
jgi:excisionase family DNA binding protein